MHIKTISHKFSFDKGKKKHRIQKKMNVIPTPHISFSLWIKVHDVFSKRRLLFVYLFIASLWTVRDKLLLLGVVNLTKPIERKEIVNKQKLSRDKKRVCTLTLEN